MPSTPEAAPIKLSCSHVWKVFGAPAGRIEGDPAATRKRLEETGGVVALADVSFDVRAGEIFVLMGLSGSGKSTLIRCLSRLVEPSSGRVVLDGQDLSAASARELIAMRRRAMGMVFQNFGLMPHLSVLDNVAFPLRIQGIAAAARRERAREMIAMVGLEGRERSLPHQLSGGQQQRVGIARSLAVDPALWFLDEPFSALDPLIRRQMQDEFLRLQRMLNKTIVFVTHDIAEAFRLADRIALMREGRIIQLGTTADIALSPADDYVARFTEDLPLSRVVTMGDLAEDGEAMAGEMETVPADMKLEEAIPQLAAGAPGFRVARADGGVFGYASAAAALKIIRRDGERSRRA